MYPFSFIILLFWIINIFRNSFKKAFLNQLTFTIFISVFIEVGYFINSNIIKIEYWQMSSILTFINALPLLSTSKITKHFLVYIAVLFLNLLFLIVIPLHKQVVVGAGGIYENVMSGDTSFIEPSFSKFSIFFFSLAVIQSIYVLVAFNKFRTNDFQYLIHKLSFGAKIIILIVIIEIIIRYLSNGTLYNNLITGIFGQSQSTYLTNVLRGSSYMLQGLTREGSHLVYALFTSLLVLFVENKIIVNNKRNDLFMYLCVVEILISMSFTSILILVMILIMYTAYNNSVNVQKNHKIFKSITIVVLILFLFVSFASSILYSLRNDYYIERFLSSFDDIIGIFNVNQNVSSYYYSSTISSTSTRIFSMVDSLSLLRFRPIFGVGIGTTFCHGSTALTLAEIGIGGLFSYIYFYFFSIRIRVKNMRKFYIIIIVIWLLGNLFISGARLFIRIDSYLLFVCLYILSYNNKMLKSKPKIE